MPELKTKTVTTREPLTRAAFVERAADGKPSRISISSDQPYLRNDGEDYYEILSHAPGAIDEERLKQGLSFLFDHNSAMPIAHAGRYVNDGHKLTLDMADFRWCAGDFAENKRADIESGAAPFTSVGYRITGDGVCIGAKDDVPIFRFPWAPHEFSSVSIPADISVGVNRSFNVRTQTKTQHRAMPETQDPPLIDEADALDRFKKKLRHIDEFVESLRNPIWREKAARVAKKHKEGNADFEAFRAEALNHFSSDVQLITPGDVGESSDGYSGNRRRTPGELFVANSDYRRNARPGGRKLVTVEMPDVRFGFGKRAFAGSDAGLTGYDRPPGVVEIQQQRLTIADLLDSVPTSQPTVRYLREKTYTNAAEMVHEGALKPEANFDLEEVDSKVRKVAVWGKVTDESFQDFPDLQQYIDGRLTWMVAEKEEQQLLNGDGLGDNLEGIRTVGGVQSLTVGADTKADAMRKAITKLQLSHYTPNGWVIHPTDWETLELLKDQNLQYYGNGPFVGAYGQQVAAVDRLWKVPVVVTTAIPQGTALLGDWSMAAKIHRRLGLLVEASNCDGDNFIRNMITIRAETRLTIATMRPLGFCEVSGL